MSNNDCCKTADKNADLNQEESVQPVDVEKELGFLVASLPFYQKGFMQKMLKPCIHPCPTSRILMMDWDDTLFPSTAFKQRGHSIVNAQSFYLDTVFMHACRELDHFLVHFCMQILPLCHIYIVTNATIGWVEQSAALAFPQLFALIEDEIPVFSAQTAFAQSPLIEPLQFYTQEKSEHWKILAFKFVLDAHLAKHHQYSSSSVVQVLSFGDSHCEHRANQFLCSYLNHHSSSFLVDKPFEKNGVGEEAQEIGIHADPWRPATSSLPKFDFSELFNCQNGSKGNSIINQANFLRSEIKSCWHDHVDSDLDQTKNLVQFKCIKYLERPEIFHLISQSKLIYEYFGTIISSPKAFNLHLHIATTTPNHIAQENIGTLSSTSSSSSSSSLPSRPAFVSSSLLSSISAPFTPSSLFPLPTEPLCTSNDSKGVPVEVQDEASPSSLPPVASALNLAPDELGIKILTAGCSSKIDEKNTSKLNEVHVDGEWPRLTHLSSLPGALDSLFEAYQYAAQDLTMSSSSLLVL